MNRREFTGLCAAAMLTVPLEAAAQAPAATRTVKFRDGRTVPGLGQGSARLAKGRHPEAAVIEALRAGISAGMTLIDTAELYGSEELIGRAIAGQRDKNIEKLGYAPASCRRSWPTSTSATTWSAHRT